MSPQRRRVLAGFGLLVPAVALLFVSVYIVLGGAGTQTCTYSGGSTAHASCATDPVGAALVTFPVAVVCLVLSAAVFRGAAWVRWPAAVVAALVATVTAAGGLAVLVALVGDGNALGALFFALGWLIVVVVCALPTLLLAGRQGAGALTGGARG
jgi:hypothetical protein